MAIQIEIKVDADTSGLDAAVSKVDELVSKLSSIQTPSMGKIDLGLGDIASQASEAESSLKSIGTSLMDQSKTFNTLKTTINNLKTTFGGLGTSIKSGFGTALSSTSNLIKSFTSSLKNIPNLLKGSFSGVSSMFSNLTKSLGGFSKYIPSVSKLGPAFATAAASAAALGASMAAVNSAIGETSRYSSQIKEIEDSFGSLETKAKELPNAISGIFSSFTSAGDQGIGMFDGVADTILMIEDALISLGNITLDGLVSAVNTLSESLSGLMMLLSVGGLGASNLISEGQLKYLEIKDKYFGGTGLSNEDLEWKKELEASIEANKKKEQMLIDLHAINTAKANAEALKYKNTTYKPTDSVDPETLKLKAGLEEELIKTQLSSYEYERYQAGLEYNKNSKTDPVLAEQILQAKLADIYKKEQADKTSAATKAYNDKQALLAKEAQKEEAFTKDWMKATSTKYEYEQYLASLEYQKMLDDNQNQIQAEQILQAKLTDINKRAEEDRVKEIQKAYEQGIANIQKDKQEQLLMGDKVGAMETEKLLKELEIRKALEGKYTQDVIDERVKANTKQESIDITKAKADMGDIESKFDVAAMGLQKSFQDAFNAVLVQGASFSQQLSNILTQSLQGIMTPITQNLSKGLSGMFSGLIGVSDTGITDTGLLGSLKGLFTGGSFTDTISGLYGSLTDGIDAGIGDMFGINSYLGETFGTSLGSIAGAGGLGYLGGKALDKIFGADTHAGSYAASGAALGTLVGMPWLGGAAGAVLGGLKGKTKHTGVSVQISGELDDLNSTLQVFDEFKKKSLFHSTKRWSVAMDKDSSEFKEIENYFQQVKDFLASINDMFSADLKIDTSLFEDKVKTEDIGDKVVEGILGEMVDIDTTIPEFNFDAHGLFGSMYESMEEQINNSIKEINVSDLKQVWADYAKNLEVSIDEAVMSGLETLASDKKDYSAFFSDYFNSNNPLKAMEEAAQEAMENYQSAMEKVGFDNVNLSNFEELRTANTEGLNFTPENVKNWHEMQGALTNAASATKDFVSALQGMVSAYDDAIATLDKDIAGYKGEEYQAPEPPPITIEGIDELIAKLKAETNNQEQLNQTEEFRTMLSDWNAQTKAMIEDLKGQNSQDEEQIAQFQTIINEAMSGVQNDIAELEAQIATEEGLGNDTTELETTLQGLTEKLSGLEDLGDQLSTEGLTDSVLAGLQPLVDELSAQKTEDVQGALETEQASLLTELQAQTAILSNIEGALTSDTADEAKDFLALVDATNETRDAVTNLPEEIANAQNTSMEPIIESFGTLGESVGEAVTTAIEPLNASMEALPETFTSALEPLNTTMATITESIGTLPESFTAAMEPLNDAMTALPDVFMSALEPLNTAMASLPEMFMSAMEPINEAMATLPEAFMAAMEPLNGIMESVTESIASLPEAFSAAMEPITASMATIPETIASAMEPINASISALEASMAGIPDSISSAISGSMDALIGAENATTSAIGSAAGTIASAVSGIGSAVSAATAAANAAAKASADALTISKESAQSSANLASALAVNSALTNANTQVLS